MNVPQIGYSPRKMNVKDVPSRARLRPKLRNKIYWIIFEKEIGQ